jgi:hypothetical protein
MGNPEWLGRGSHVGSCLHPHGLLRYWMGLGAVDLRPTAPTKPFGMKFLKRKWSEIKQGHR